MWCWPGALGAETGTHSFQLQRKKGQKGGIYDKYICGPRAGENRTSGRLKAWVWIVLLCMAASPWICSTLLSSTTSFLHSSCFCSLTTLAPLRLAVALIQGHGPLTPPAPLRMISIAQFRNAGSYDRHGSFLHPMGMSVTQIPVLDQIPIG